MNSAETVEKLDQSLQTRGFQYRIVSIKHLGDLRNRIQNNIADHSITAPVYQLYKDNFEPDAMKTFASAQAIIIVAAPQPIAEIIFNVRGRKVTTIVPPTYHHDTDPVALQALESVLTPLGWRVVRAPVPLKLLAVHSGLAKYGKNNIVYIDGMGSFFRLAAFATDFPSTGDSWQDLQELDLCTRCTACIRKCPTGAISADRFIVRAERCLTYFTERTEDFPDWIDSSWHHCLVGCMRCQTCCPANKDVRSSSRVIAEFSEEETATILQVGSTSGLPAEARALTERTGLSEDIQAVIPRNLRALIDRLPTSG